MKYLRKICPIICSLFLVFVLLSVSACNDEDYNPYTDEKADRTYTINKITSTVTVNSDSTVDFVEEYEVDFHQGHLGIYRDLPLNSGEKYRDIKIIKSEWHQTEHTDNVLRISLGLPDSADPVRGKHSYAISYKLILPKHADNVNLYMNLVGYGWTTDIEEVDITLNLPAEMSGPKFYHRYGSTSQSDKVRCSLIGNNQYKITAADLSAFEGITLDAELPEGALTSYREDFPFAELFIAAVFLIVAAAIVVYAKKGQEVIPITNYYPPKNDGNEMTPADVGLYIDGNLSNSDVTSMIFYWASKGYIRIDDVESKNPRLVKQKEISVTEAGGREFLRLYDKIFAKGDSVGISSLEYKLSGCFEKIIVGSLKQSRTFFSKKPIIFGFVTALCAAVISVLLFVFKGLAAVGSADVVLGAGVASVFALIAGYGSMFALWRYSFKIKGSKIIMGIAAVAVSVIVALITNLIYKDIIPYYAAVMVTVPLAVLCLACGLCQKRNEDYRKLMGEIIGFKDFLTVAEKDKLEMLLKDNPQYYYDILPYANVLGVSDIWEHKFDGISLEPPSYMRGYHSMYFDYLIYRNLTHSLTRGMSAAMSPKPSQSSSSGFHGGGGGGFHGGGGGFGGGGGGAR